MSRARNLFSASSVPKPTIQNREGYGAYERPLEEQFLQVLLTNTLGNTFYARQEDLLKESVDVHTDMIDADPDFAAKAIVYARNHGFMRLQPTMALACLSQYNFLNVFEKVFEKTILIPSDLQDFMTIIAGQGRGTGGRAIKRAIKKFLNEKLTEYWALKYNGRGRGFSLGDLIKIAHPVPKDEKQSMLFRYLIGKEDWGETENVEEGPHLHQIAAYEMLKGATTDQERIYWIKEGRLPHEIVTSAVENPSTAVWEAIMKEMPIFALLRNLNTLQRHGVLNKPENRNYIVDRLTDETALAKSKILPMQFLKAFDAVQDIQMRAVIRLAVEKTFNNLPDIPGRTAIFLDVSGSMEGEFLMTAAIFAFALYKKTGGNGLFWLFDHGVYDAKPSLHDTILSQAAKIRPQGGTNTSLPVRVLMDKREFVDNIIMITDEQQNTGSNFYQRLKEYQNTVNRNVKTFIVDVAPYRSAMTPDDPNVFYIYGWSDQVLKFISLAAQGYGTMAEHVRRMEL